MLFNKHNINFYSQYTWEDCKDQRVLPFDFYLPDYNLVIEIMGEQHERPIEIFGGEKAFKKRIYHDKIKRDYLKCHGINVLDIWYYEFDDMEDLILEKIKNLINKNSSKEETT